MHTQPRPPAVTVPDFGPDEYVRFDANDRAAEYAGALAAAACGDAGPSSTTSSFDAELGEPPF